MAFWDASAIAPLCCSRAASAQGRRLQRELKRMVVWWGTPLEVRSAAIALLGQLRVTWDKILPTEKLRPLAEDLPDLHRVRAADAAKLAAALVWCRERPRQRPFVCFDDRLRAAASALGFSVRP